MEFSNAEVAEIVKEAASTPVEIPTGRKADFSEVGNTGLNQWGGQLFEEFLPNLRWPRAAKVYLEMLSNDPVVGAIFYMAEQLIRKCTWTVIPAGEKKEDLQAAQFLKECLDDMSTSWTDTIAEILSYLGYGWSWHEIVYKKRDGDQKDPTRRSKFNDGRIGWRRLPGRSQGTLYGWVFDENNDGGVKAMQQLGATNALVNNIPIEKSLLFRTKADRNNPEGRSLLRNAYRPWYFKKHIEEIEGIGIERDLAGLPVLTTPEGVDIWNPNSPMAVTAKNKAESLVRNIRRDKNEGVVLPFGWDLTLLSSQSRRQFDTNAILNRYDQRIAITLLADIVMLGADKVGSFALADVKKSLLGAALEAQLEIIASVFNKYAIPRLFALNAFIGLTDYPKLQSSEIEAPDLPTTADYLQKLSGCGMPLFPNLALENFLRQKAGLPTTEEDDPARKAKEDAAEGSATPGATTQNGTQSKPDKPTSASDRARNNKENTK